MEKDLWDQVLKNWERTYYTVPLWILCSLFSSFIAIKFYQKTKANNLLLTYSIIFLVLVIFLIYTNINLKGLVATTILELANTLFAIAEVNIFLVYFSPFISSKKITTGLKAGLTIYNIFATIFLIGLFFFNFTEWQILTLSLKLNALEFVLLLIICLCYFYELMLKKTTDAVPLFKLPSVWVASGLLMYVLISLPLLLVGDTINSYNRNLFIIMFSVHYISISILLLCIAKALKCKTSQPI